MASKKGIILTVGILAAITAASFLVWLIPQNIQPTFVISDHEDNLDDVKEIHSTIQTVVEQEFDSMLNQNLSPQEYIDLAEISSTQINSQIIQLVESDAPEEWQQSYLNYMEALRTFNSQIRETIVVATMIKENKSSDEIQQSIERINSLKADSESLVLESDNTRP